MSGEREVEREFADAVNMTTAELERWLGTADSRAEQFELTLEGATAARGVIIRATDALNNITSARGEAPAAPARR